MIEFPKELPEDLRKMDEKQFLKVVKWLKEKTDGWKRFPEEVLSKKPQMILVLRIALGLSRSVFARKVGINKEVLRHVEAGRKKTVPLLNKWGEKITIFLSSNELKENIPKALFLWRELKFKQLDEKTVDDEVKKKLESLDLPKDLRKINEKQFIELFHLLKERTRNFTVFPVSLLTTDSRILFVVRIILRKTQKELAKELGCSKDWVRHTESGANRIMHFGPASRWCHKIEGLLKKTEITLDKSLLFLKRIKFVRKDVKTTPQGKPLKDLSTKDFIAELSRFRSATNDFKQITPQILEEDPRRIFILRMILKISKKELGKKCCVDRKTISKWEMGKPIELFSAARIAKFAEKELKDRKIEIEDIVDTFLKVKRGKFRFNFNRVVENGFRLAERVKLNPFEKKIKNILEKIGVSFETHATVEGAKRKLNVDFVIPNKEKPKIVIEAFETNAKVSRARLRICAIDQRFHQLKVKNPDIVTVMAIGFKRATPTKDVKEFLAKEVLDTDFLLLNDEVLELSEILKQKL